MASPTTGSLFISKHRGQARAREMSLPARPPSPIDPPAGIAEALGVEPIAVLRANKLMAMLDGEAAVAALDPVLGWIAAQPSDGLIATARGDAIDFVSRYFAPHAGIDEDPVTGSAHCSLAPYWAGELGRDRLEARQISARGGSLTCVVAGDRVDLVGDAVMYLRGHIQLGA